MSKVNLSDYNVSGQRVSIVSRYQQYSDLDLSLIPHPQKKDIIPLTDIDAVRQSVKNLILTARYERPFQPQLGSNIRSLLFENSDTTTSYLIKNYIKEVINQYEPRVNGLIIEVDDDSDNNAYYITVTFNVISISTNANVKIYLERLR
tara:strand:+ start:886 stop:1329 length:444 start_codon:yes stop_codon:yes gene_type:complete